MKGWMKFTILMRDKREERPEDVRSALHRIISPKVKNLQRFEILRFTREELTAQDAADIALHTTTLPNPEQEK